jgi:DNA-binding protein WhiA
VRSVAGREGARLGLAERSSHALAYAKGWETIETVLAAAGATDAVIALEERALVASARADANRLANADHANLVRAGRAARIQLEALRKLRTEGAFDRLDDRLREAAELRLRHPTLSLRELAARADPPATKAGMQRRLDRLVRLADA